MKKDLIIFWHIIEQCNWRCTHCYHEQYLDSGPSLQKLKDTFDEILEINDNFFGKLRKKTIKFIGGEPLIRKDFILLLEYINSKVEYLNIRILTNGSLLDEEFLYKLKKLKNLDFWFQISIEGREKINDKIRGKGAFKIIEQKIILLKKMGFNISLALTLSKKNKDEVFKLVPFIKKYDILLDIKRLVLIGKSTDGHDLLLSPEERYRFSIKVANVNINILKKNLIDIGVIGNTEGTKEKYKGVLCRIAYHRVITILHNLDVVSCRKLPIVLGNLKNQKLKEIFLGKEYLEQVESSEKIEVCKKCTYYNKCKGGAKCVTYSKEKTLINEDPQCLIAKLLKKKNHFLKK